MTEDELRNALICAESISGSPAGLVPILHAQRIAIEYANAQMTGLRRELGDIRSASRDTAQAFTDLEAEFADLCGDFAKVAAERDRLKEQLASHQHCDRDPIECTYDALVGEYRAASDRAKFYENAYREEIAQRSDRLPPDVQKVVLKSGTAVSFLTCKRCGGARRVGSVLDLDGLEPCPDCGGSGRIDRTEP